MYLSNSIKYLINLSLDDITNLHDLSKRSYNICKSNGLLNVGLITDYYRLNKSFKGLKNCGLNSDQELTRISLKYISKIHANDEKVEDINGIVNNFNRDHKDLLNSIILLNFNSLSVRSRNALNMLLNNNLSIKTLCQNNLLNKKFEIKYLHNVGEKSSQEIIKFLELIKEYVLKFFKARSIEDLKDLRNEILLKSRFNSVNIEFDLVHSKSIFILIDKLINSHLLFSGNNNQIFTKLFNIYEENVNFSIDEVAVTLHLTRERIRQLRNNIFDNLIVTFKFIESFKEDFKETYTLTQVSSFLNITDEFILTINSSNNTRFTKQFLKYLIYFFYKDTHVVIGDLSDVLLTNLLKPKGRYIWKDIYIIESITAKNFDFTAFVNDINRRIEEKVNEEYKFNFKSYLSRFLYNLELQDINRLFPVCEKIIREEFDLNLDSDDNIIFKRNTVKQVYEYAIDALKLLNKPSKVEEIYEIIRQTDSSVTKSADALRGSLHRKNNGLIYFGRESTYGLEIWESEKENIKGGTIKDIAKEYLNQFEIPIHIRELTNHVLKFRVNSNENSIFYNLKIDPKNSFAFFKGRLVGLSEKKYPSFFLVQDRKKLIKKDWKVRCQELKDFLLLNERFPYSEKGSDQEKTLYRWFNIQKYLYQNEKLKEDRTKLFEEIILLKENYEN